MTATAELMQKGYSAGRRIGGSEGTLLYLVRGLTDNSGDPSEALNAIPFGRSAPWPASMGGTNAMGLCVCVDLRIVRRPSPDKAFVLATFSTRRWSFPVKMLSRFDTKQTVDLVQWIYYNYSTPTQPCYVAGPDQIRPRTVFRKVVQEALVGEISDSMMDTIAQGTGCLYSINGRPYVFAGANTLSTSDGKSTIEYHYVTTASVPARIPAVNALPLPALGNLDEYKLDIDNNGVYSINVAAANTLYPLNGPVLP